MVHHQHRRVEAVGEVADNSSVEGILLDTQHIIRDRKEEDLISKNQEAETNLPYLHHWQLHYLLHLQLHLEKGVTEEVIIQIIY